MEQILLGDDSRKQSKLMYKHFSYVGAFFAQPKKLMNKHLALALYTCNKTSTTEWFYFKG